MTKILRGCKLESWVVHMWNCGVLFGVFVEYVTPLPAGFVLIVWYTRFHPKIALLHHLKHSFVS